MVAVATSTVFSDPNNAIVSLFKKEENPKRDNHLASIAQPNGNSGQFSSHETATANVFDDLCRLHGNLLDSSFTFDQHSQTDRDKNTATIDIIHEIFDSSFGLVPYVPYTGTNCLRTSTKISVKLEKKPSVELTRDLLIVR